MKVSNLPGVPQLLYDSMAECRPPVKGEVHVTQLIDPTLKEVMRRRYWDDIEEDISQRFWALLGTCIHAGIANDGRIAYAMRTLSDLLKYWDEWSDATKYQVVSDVLASFQGVGPGGIESKLEWKMDGWKLVGTDDHYMEDDAEIIDWKCTSVWSIIFADHIWEEQLNVYAYMRRQLGYEVKKLTVWALLRDWQKSKAMTDNRRYPAIPFVKVNLPLWSEEKQHAYISERLANLTKYLNAPVEQMPCCTDKERWISPTKYKVMGKGRKKALVASVKNDEGEREELLSVAEAIDAARAKGIDVDGTKVWVQEFKGEYKRCKLYCSVNFKCPYYIGDKDGTED